MRNDWAELIRQLYRHPSVLGGGPSDVNAAVEAIGNVVPDLNLQVVKYNLLDSWLRSGTGAGKSTLKTDFICGHFTAKKSSCQNYEVFARNLKKSFQKILEFAW